MGNEAVIAEKLKLFDRISNVRSPEFAAIRKQALELSTKAAENLYKWAFAIITLASAILGVSATGFIKLGIIQIEYLFILALLILAFNVVHGVWILKNRVETDINGMAEQQAFLNDLIYGGVQEARHRIIDSQDDDEEFKKITNEFKEAQKVKLASKEAEHEARKNQKDYTTDYLFYPFLIGVVLLVVSVVPWSRLWAFN